MTLQLPAEWTEAKPINPAIVLKAESPHARSVCVFSTSKADIVSLESYAKNAHDSEMAVLKNPQSTDAIKLKVGGRPAIRYDITYDDGTYRWGVVEIITETSNRYNTFVVTGLRSEFDTQKEDWVILANGLSEKPSTPQR